MEPNEYPELPAQHLPDPNTAPLFDMPPAEPFGTPAAPTARHGFGNLVARMRKPRRAVVVGLTAAALAATGGVALAAANGSGQSTPPAMGPGMRAARGMLHGEFTVADGKGGYQTELVQRGTVTSFSGGTLTVSSADGYTHGYSTDSTTKFGHGRGLGHGRWMGGPMNQPNQNGTPTQGAVPTLPGTGAPNAAPGSTTAAAPAATVTVGENVAVIAIHSGNTDHAQRVMPMRQMNQNGQNNQNGGPGGFFGHRRGGREMMGPQFPGWPGMQGQMPGMQGQQGGTAPADPGTSTAPAPMNGGTVAPAPADPPAAAPDSTGDSATTNG